MPTKQKRPILKPGMYLHGNGKKGLLLQIVTVGRIYLKTRILDRANYLPIPAYRDQLFTITREFADAEYTW